MYTEYIKYIEPQTVLLINTHYIFEAIQNVFNSLSVSYEYGIVSDLILFTRLFEVLILWLEWQFGIEYKSHFIWARLLNAFFWKSIFDRIKN